MMMTIKVCTSFRMGGLLPTVPTVQALELMQGSRRIHGRIHGRTHGRTHRYERMQCYATKQCYGRRQCYERRGKHTETDRHLHILSHTRLLSTSSSTSSSPSPSRYIVCNDENIDTIVETIMNDKLVAIPTETVYGLACNALSPAAAELVFRTKARPLTDPLIGERSKSTRKQLTMCTCIAA
jgi:hypothetical protein